MSQRYKPAQDTGRPKFKDLAEEIGEDPGRFLDVGGKLMWARIAGIDRVDVARAWVEVEIELADVDERKPRSDVIGALNERIEQLKEHGGREEQLKHKRGIRVESDKTVTFVDDDGEHYTPEEWEDKRTNIIDRATRSPEQAEGTQDAENAQDAQEADVDELVDEDEGVKSVTHSEPDEPKDGGGSGGEEGGKTVNQDAQNDSDDQQVDPDELGGHNAAIYRYVDQKGPVSRAGVAGGMTIRRDLDLEAVDGLVDFLVGQGLLEETADGLVTL